METNSLHLFYSCVYTFILHGKIEWFTFSNKLCNTSSSRVDQDLYDWLQDSVVTFKGDSLTVPLGEPSGAVGVHTLSYVSRKEGGVGLCTGLKCQACFLGVLGRL